LSGGITVTVNVAMSLNGMIAGANGRRVRISGTEDLKRVHNLRASSDAILVGANTIINDNPFLTVDPRYSKSSKLPARVILDINLTSPRDSNVYRSPGQRTLLFTSRDSSEYSGAEVIRKNPEELTIEGVLKQLKNMGFKNILVEGGRNVISQFLHAGLVDIFTLYVGNILIEAGGMPLFSPDQELEVRVLGTSTLGNGVVINLDPQSLYHVGKP
jgi:riboflavin-specific deaminase-like protein